MTDPSIVAAVPPATPVTPVVAPVLSLANLTHTSSLLGYASLALPVVVGLGAVPAPTTGAGWAALAMQAAFSIFAILQKPVVAAAS